MGSSPEVGERTRECGVLETWRRTRFQTEGVDGGAQDR